MSSPKCLFPNFNEELILGSQSPRRKEILSYFSIPFKVVTPTFNEDSTSFQGDPISYVRALSKGKALSLLRSRPNATILTADTVVFKDGRIYNKPSTVHEAKEMLADLSNEWHTVYTGLTLVHGEDCWFEVESTRVLFQKLSPQRIHLYASQLSLLDKAGAYAIQEAGALIVKRIEGCFYNVMGLPIGALANLLAEINLDLWEYLSETQPPQSVSAS